MTLKIFNKLKLIYSSESTSKASTMLSIKGGDQILPWPGQPFSLQVPESYHVRSWLTENLIVTVLLAGGTELPA